MIKILQKSRVLYVISCLVLLLSPISSYAQSTSPNYRVEETFFGTGGEVDASSTNYRAQQSAGSLGVGNTSSNNYDAVGGNITPNAPYLEMSVTGSDVDLGTLSSSATSYQASQGGTCNCSFYVRTYLSSQYSVITASQPPTSENGDTLDAKTTQGAPSGSETVEEFGMNLVTNTVLGTFGATAVNIPDNSFADGNIASGYEVSDQFKYNVGDVIAQSPNTVGNQAVGQTNYTISYIAKVSNLTPAGNYTMRHVLVAVPTY